MVMQVIFPDAYKPHLDAMKCPSRAGPGFVPRDFRALQNSSESGSLCLSGIHAVVSFYSFCALSCIFQGS